jgi:hypothetical protein
VDLVHLGLPAAAQHAKVPKHLPHFMRGESRVSALHISSDQSCRVGGGVHLTPRGKQPPELAAPSLRR